LERVFDECKIKEGGSMKMKRVIFVVFFALTACFMEDIYNDHKPKSVGAKAISAGISHSLVLKNDGTVWAAGDNSFGQLGDGTGIGRNVFKMSTIGR
jgi:alpha-tubulin suppressor-like RCC1 family protein